MKKILFLFLILFVTISLSAQTFKIKYYAKVDEAGKIGNTYSTSGKITIDKSNGKVFIDQYTERWYNILWKLDLQSGQTGYFIMSMSDPGTKYYDIVYSTMKVQGYYRIILYDYTTEKMIMYFAK